MIQMKSVIWTCIHIFVLSIVVSSKAEGELSKTLNQPTTNTSGDIKTKINQNSANNPTAPSSSKDAVSVALQKCEEYANYRYVKKLQPPMAGNPAQSFNTIDCANVEPLIVGGIQAKPKEYPHMALIGSGSSFENVSWNCGGSLISEKFVLSSAQCGQNIPSLGQAQWILLGDLDRNSKTDDAKPAVYKIKKVHQHPNFTSKSMLYDIALFELNTTVEMSPYVRPACLYTSTSVPVNTTGKITGWGRTGVVDRKSSDHLLKASISFLDDKKCVEKYPNDSPRNQRVAYDPNSMICAGEFVHGADTCAGDSGGPLQKPVDKQVCMWNILGITSFGSSFCGDKKTPAVYTKVAFYLEWIKNIVWT
ncbi:chymotrypsinogen B-like isoform X2 [Planococcus citri]|uniref:chymotrypsinogen B-like isoform X2 n=1 Tax=Planococcus citri TaxID=170843 RepID=UPI0031F8CD2D